MDNKSKNQGIPTFTPPEDGAPVFTPPKTPQHDGPVCYHHPSEPAVARCARCGKYICKDCAEAYTVMLHYSPDQLHLYMMDFKGGTEFKIYESERLPHIQLLALDAMQEFGESILQNLIEEMENRSNAFKNAGGYTKIEDYVRGTGNPMPRILVIMDEFQILFDDSTNRKVAMRSANHAKRIVTEGRAYGVHLLMAKFPERIIFSLNDNDADNLVENVSVTGLRDNTVYFTDGVKDTYQMKPYIAPTAMELEHFLSSLN